MGVAIRVAEGARCVAAMSIATGGSMGSYGEVV